MAKPASTAWFPTISHPKKRAVLSAYLECSQVKPACKLARTDFSMHYYWLKTDAAYAEAFAEAKSLVGAMLEDEAIRRAKGWQETHTLPDGTQIQVPRHSDTLLIFLLKGAMPEKYRERYEVSGTPAQPLPMVAAAIARQVVALSPQERQLRLVALRHKEG